MPEQRDVRVIGGVFALEARASTPSPPDLLAGGPLMLCSGRAALAAVLATLAPRRVWLPAFVCESVVDVVVPSALRFYGVGASLTELDVADVLPGDAVLVVDYFGWPAPAGLVGQLRGAGAIVIEDACHALLTSGVGAAADWWIASPRKFLGVPDGGLLGPPSPSVDADAGGPPGAWWLEALNACVGRRAFEHGAPDRSWFEAYGRAEAAVPVAPHAMSELTRLVLSEGIDAPAIAAARRRNYACLHQLIGDLGLMGPLADGVVPLGFPICHDERDRLRSALFEEQVFPPVHWPVPDAVPQRFVAERRLAASVMTVPCDQRYDESDMRRVAELIRAVR